jgi:hypothetical protein
MHAAQHGSVHARYYADDVFLATIGGGPVVASNVLTSIDIERVRHYYVQWEETKRRLHRG